MEKLTEKQINEITRRMSKMSEAQKDIYAQKLQEAGFLDKILGVFGSPTKNMQKLAKQRDDSIKQIEAMKQAIDAATTVQGLDPNQLQATKQKDIAALDAIIQKLQAINVNIQIDETPAGGDQAANGDGKDNGENKDANAPADGNQQAQ